ncbi:unnamed protein product, partial [Ectocarpus sp. 8 AP-2014]
MVSQDRDHMLRELIAQVVGEFVNSDGTFRAAGKVMDEAQCLYFLMGEDAKILGYGAVKSESEEELTRLFQRYADRRRKKGTLHALRWLYDDRCCRGCKDVTKYYGVQIFPHVERAPLADSFHATQNLAGATTSKSHERRGVYARGVGGSVRSKYKPDVDAVVEYLMRENKRMTRAEAERKTKSKSMSRYVRTVSRPIEETIAEVSEVVRLHARLDAEGRERGELPLLQPELPPGKRGPRGAQAELKSLVSCLRKGCGQDPLPVDKMYLHVGTGKKTKLKRYVKKGGTAKNESFHRSLNAMTSSVSRLGPGVCDQRLLRLVHRFNLDKDRKLGRASKHSTLWVWRERDINDAARKCLVAEPFPKAGSRPDVQQEDLDAEPMGFEYAKRLREDRLGACRQAAMHMVGVGSGAPVPESGMNSRPPPLPLATVPETAVQGGREAGGGEGSGAGASGVQGQDSGAGSAAGSRASGAGRTSGAGIGPQESGAGSADGARASGDTAGPGAAGEGAAGEGAAGRASENLGGARRRPMRKNTVEGQRCFTPQTEAEVACWSQAVAEAIGEGVSPSKVVPKAVDKFNTQYFVQAFSPGTGQGRLRGPTSVRQAEKLSKERASSNLATSLA